MPGPLDFLPLLIAQVAGAAAPAAGQDAPSSPLLQYLPFIMVPVLFFVLILRPQQQADRKRKDLLGGIKKNDKVLTSGGIYGTVISVDKESNRVVLRVDEDGRVKIPFSIASVVQVIEVSPVKATEAG